LGNMLYSKAYGYRRSLHDPNTGIYYRDTKYEDAIWYDGHLLLSGLQDGYGGGDTDSCGFDKGTNLWFGFFNNKANLIAKKTIVETDGEQLTNLFIMNSDLYALGLSETGGAFPNTFSCDTTSDIQFLIKLMEAPLSVSTIKDKERAKLFKIYPNPASENMRIELRTEAIRKKSILLITDASGKKVLRKRLRNKINNINCSHWPSGIYYIQVQSANTRQTKKFIKQ